MPRYTLELRQLEELGINIFEFTYERNPQAQAILSNEELEAGFKRHFNFREIGQETPERFKYFLETKWKEHLFVFDNVLIALNKEFDVLSTSEYNSESVSIDNDTPKNALDFGAEKGHASFIANNKTKGSGRSGVSGIALIEEYKRKLFNAQVEFYDSLDSLFMQIF